ncbi:MULTISPECIES: flagellar basal body P-ring formation chaperone FlgA [unclassified Endozoicomonas]|uniref:flagellar basal body P-ring formation chaperone FlgA n=2 Tax=Endozoicomonas TaxID=305899 RepID=UPI00214780F5|nr:MULTISPECIES: flagellar basal body P-ring formation chaperone FlgA [unclassified Endozoicomonas]
MPLVISHFRPLFRSSIIIASLFSPHTSSDTNLAKEIERRVYQSVEKEVAGFIQSIPGARYELKVRPLSSSKSRRTCQGNLSVSAGSGTRPPVGAVKRIVECPGEWRMTVMAENKILVPVIHSIRALARGQRLTADALQFLEVDYSRLRGQFFTEISEIRGRVIKRSIGAQKLISANMLEKDYVIRKGEIVQIIAGGNGLEVSMSGASLDDGEIHETIRVRNRSSGKIVHAEVISTGKVRIHH